MMADTPSPSPVPAPAEKAARLLSLDTYRGFLMLVLATSAFQIHKVAPKFKGSAFWDALAYQFNHPAWRSCTFWDLVQPLVPAPSITFWLRAPPSARPPLSAPSRPPIQS